MDDDTRLAADPAAVDLTAIRNVLANTVRAGVITGVFAGSMMMVFMVLYSGGIGAAYWLPPKLIDAMSDGVVALVGGPGVVVAGLAIHLIVSVVWATLFALLMDRRWSALTAMAHGILYSFAVWAIMTYLVMPWANPTMNPRIHAMMGMWICAHVIFGACLAIAPPLRRALFGQTVRSRLWRTKVPEVAEGTAPLPAAE